MTDTTAFPDDDLPPGSPFERRPTIKCPECGARRPTDGELAKATDVIGALLDALDTATKLFPILKRDRKIIAAMIAAAARIEERDADAVLAELLAQEQGR